jgi:hypothetical protein
MFKSLERLERLERFVKLGSNQRFQRTVLALRARPAAEARRYLNQKP